MGNLCCPREGEDEGWSSQGAANPDQGYVRLHNSIPTRPHARHTSDPINAPADGAYTFKAKVRQLDERRSLRPMQKHRKGTKRWALHTKIKSELINNEVNMRSIVKLPEYEMLNE